MPNHIKTISAFITPIFSPCSKHPIWVFNRSVSSMVETQVFCNISREQNFCKFCTFIMPENGWYQTPKLKTSPIFFFLPKVLQPAVPCSMGRVSGGYRRVMEVTFRGRSNGQIKKIGCVGKSASKALLNLNTEKFLFQLFRTPLFWAFKMHKIKI